MGFNTVALILNDAMYELAQSPKTLTRLLTCPPLSDARVDEAMQEAVEYGKDHGEQGRRIWGGAVQVQPSFHADFLHYFVAGGNTLKRLNFIRFGRTPSGKPTITLEIPDWAAPEKYRSTAPMPRKRAKAWPNE